MPYTYSKEGSKYVVYKKNKAGQRGKKVGSTDGTKEALKKYLAALHAAENTNEGLMNVASKIERFLKPKDKNTKFKEDLQDLYYSDRTKYNELKQHYMDQVESGRQSVDIEMVLKAFDEIENSVNENIYDDIKATNPPFKQWTYDETYPAKGRTKEEAAIYVRMKYPEVGEIDLEKMQGGINNISYTDNYVMSIYSKEPVSEMKDKLRKIVKELMADMPPMDKVPTEMPAMAPVEQMKAQLNTMTLDQLYTLGKQISSNFRGFNPSFVGMDEKQTEDALRKEIKRFMDKNQNIVKRMFNFDGNTITLKAVGLYRENKMNKKDLIKMIREEISSMNTVMRLVNPEHTYIVKIQKNGERITTYPGVSGEDAKRLMNTRENFMISADSILRILGEDPIVREEGGTYTAHVETDPVETNKGNAITLEKADSPFIQDRGTKVNENKMKVNTLKEIIREEIKNVMNENRGLSGGEMMKYLTSWFKYNPGDLDLPFDEVLAKIKAGQQRDQELDRRADQSPDLM
jgi:hypothetical protein